ncbi:unnamed protein product [Durusdinium trenchii]|uniref:PB1 domain-containing protein n=1 Tax=Durusdinium trenchii TaxID=1381693 RepID=A0ABP0MUD6_9DINO
MSFRVFVRWGGREIHEEIDSARPASATNVLDLIRKTWGLPSSFFTLKWGDGDGTILCGSELLRELSNGNFGAFFALSPSRFPCCVWTQRRSGPNSYSIMRWCKY